MVYVIHTHYQQKAVFHIFCQKIIPEKLKKPQATCTLKKPLMGLNYKLDPTEIMSINEFDCYLHQIQNILF